MCQVHVPRLKRPHRMKPDWARPLAILHESSHVALSQVQVLSQVIPNPSTTYTGPEKGPLEDDFLYNPTWFSGSM